MPTPTLEEYLETIYKLSQLGPVKPTPIAEDIGVSGPTVTATLKRLEAHGFIERVGTDVVLTSEGVARSVEIVRKHRISERFLVDMLGLDWEAAHEEACLLEHALSPRVVDALEVVLNNPTECPHGHPIPSADGSVAASGGRPLDELEVGQAGTVLRVAESEQMLGYLGAQGLRPGAFVTVTDMEPFDGPLTLDVDGTRCVLAREVSRLVTVGNAS